MSKINVKIILLGHLKRPINKLFFKNWRSKIIQIEPEINRYLLNFNSDSDGWIFSDTLLEEYMNSINNINFSDGFLVAIVNVPLEKNYYTRRLSNNRIVITMHEIYSVLENDNIPFENLILHRIYAYSILYKRYGRIPDHRVRNSHDETRGCLFDMNPYKEDLVYSSRKPIFCDECNSQQTQNGVPVDFIYNVRSEIKKIRKSIFHQILDFVKKHPIISIIISALFAILIEFISNFLYDLTKRPS